MTSISQAIANDAKLLGIKKGDTLLVHSSLRSLGKIPAEAVIKGLLTALGDEGTLVLPALSYMHCNPTNPRFDYHNTPSNVGALAEYFRTEVKGVIRSINPTHSCCALGKNADFVVSSHILDTTPCGANSPFRKVMELNGKILFLGCGMVPNTSMHAVEELSKPDYLFGDCYKYTVTDNLGNNKELNCYAHNFKGVIQRYDRLESILINDELKKGKILSADCHLVYTPAMWERADKQYRADPHYFIDKG